MAFQFYAQYRECSVLVRRVLDSCDRESKIHLVRKLAPIVQFVTLKPFDLAT